MNLGVKHKQQKYLSMKTTHEISLLQWLREVWRPPGGAVGPEKAGEKMRKKIQKLFTTF